MDVLYSMIVLTLIFSTPIIITAIGGLFSERSGVVNIALEGIMMIGGFFAATAIVFLEQGNAPWFAWLMAIVIGFLGGFTLTRFKLNPMVVVGSGVVIGIIAGFIVNSLSAEWMMASAPWLALIVGTVGGAVISLVHAYLSINLSADQVISGTAINLLAGGLTIYLSQIIFGQQRTQTFQAGFIKTTYAGFSEIPVIGPALFTNIYPTVYLALFLVIASWFVLYQTPFGLRLRATGEHPQAVDSMGISVYKMRYIGVILSGCFAGLGGSVMVLTFDTQYTAGSIHGIGFIALAALIFGQWKPWGLFGASLFFGFSQILGIFATSFDLLSRIPTEFFNAFPYILTVIALVVFSGQAVGPRAAGEPYDKGQR